MLKLDRLPRVDDAGAEELFAMKSYVIHQRVRSRDLYDLKTFMMRGKSLADILRAGSAADPACSPEYAKSVLVGDVPLDNVDEGFDSIGVTESMQDIYAFFKGAVNDYEQAIAEETLKNEGGSLPLQGEGWDGMGVGRECDHKSRRGHRSYNGVLALMDNWDY